MINPKQKLNLFHIPLKTELGIFILEVTSKGIYAVRFPKSPSLIKGDRQGKRYLSPLFRKAKLDLTGYTPFQKKVCRALMKVPCGKVITYGALAKKAGHPKAARAIGAAMKKNRLPVVIPCHRVVPAGGGIGQYSAGVNWKRVLLVFERRALEKNMKTGDLGLVPRDS